MSTLTPPFPIFADPFADTLELPTTWEVDAPSADWEREEIQRQVSGQFQIVREIGRGGMGVVFLARDIALHRLVAIKVLRSEFTGSDDHRERFRREARMTARLSHPSIVPVHSFGELGDLVYIVMKYVHGESLADRLRREGSIPEEEAQRIIRELAFALDYAHGEGVIHRDLKAENILLERGTGRPMLTDFGVAMLRSVDPAPADASRAFGTPHYMSPEQAAGELDLDGRSDLYSLGVLGYYMLTGSLPFDGATFESLAAKHIADAHVPLADRMPALTARLSVGIERCLLKDRDERWRRGRDLADTLAVRPKSRRWFRHRPTVRSALLRTRMVAELAMFASAMKAVLFRWTTI
jgi:serine/threonine protein kinase